MKEEIKKKLKNLKNKEIIIKVDVGRNKKEEHKGRILDIYNNVWTFETKNGIKSFSYSDVFINNVEISS